MAIAPSKSNKILLFIILQPIPLENFKKREADAVITEKKDTTIQREIWVCDGIGADYVRYELDFRGLGK